MTAPEWQRFFDGHAPSYLQNSFTRNTIAEADFLVELLDLPPGSAILDMGCGAGRHSVELARRGYRLTGVDLSAGMLAEAHKAAAAAGVEVEWIQADATRFQAGRYFDTAICLCEGAFGLLSSGDDPAEHDRAILANIYAALRFEAPFVLTALNGLRAIRQHSQEDVRAGRFDPLTLVASSTMEWDGPAGHQSVAIRERLYLPQELAAMFAQTGFTVEHIWGGTAGQWGRRPVELDEMEVMVVGRKATF
jgi:cyclopropane fatty-acyl-phospholipid synthase-like methyltransferase